MHVRIQLIRDDGSVVIDVTMAVWSDFFLPACAQSTAMTTVHSTLR